MAERDPEAVLRFVEHFASALVDAGIARMPARIFAALHTADSGRLTAAELAEMLQISPAAVSGAVRSLTQFDLVRREREPGSRRDVYVVDSDMWYEATLRRDRVLLRWQASAREGVEVLGPDTEAGIRMAESLAFLEFLHRELPVALEKWQKVKSELQSSRNDSE